MIYLQTAYDLKDKPINTHLRSVRALIYYCQKLNYVKEFKVELVKTRDEVKETYTAEEINLLLKKPDTKNCSFATFRNWATVNFFLATGVRLSTLLNLKIKNLDFENMLINLSHTKNRRAQLLPMSTSLFEVLQEYLCYRKGDTDDYLFCSQKTGKQLTKRGLQKAIESYHLSRGVNTYSIHKYRHTFAKLALKKGVDAFTLMRLLGHSSIEITKQYIHLFAEDLQEGFNDYCPLEQFSNANGKTVKMR